MDTNYESLISKSCKNIPKSFVREILSVCDKPEFISFAGGLPNPTYFPVEQMKEAFEKIMISEGKTTLQYAESQGYYLCANGFAIGTIPSTICKSLLITSLLLMDRSKRWI